MKFSVFQVSRKGGRGINEDRMGYCYTSKSCIFLLMDGMGGHPQGEVAAQLALQTVSAMFQKEAKPQLPNVSAFLELALMAAHRQILSYAVENRMPDSPRTTIVAVVVQSGLATWIHCGDSRLYWVRQRELLTRTRDHSFVEKHQVAAAGLKLPQHINRNILFTCLGSPTKPVFDISAPVVLQQGDKVMLCSDGIWGSLSEADIVNHLGNKPVDQAVPDLVEKALQKAGDRSDNVSCLAFEWETPDGFELERGGISTDTINDGVFASTVKSGLSDPFKVDQSSVAIERSIAEIGEAIQRTTVKKS